VFDRGDGDVLTDLMWVRDWRIRVRVRSGIRLGGVWLRVGVGDRVERGGIAAEGSQEIGGGYGVAEPVS
jgi:hypothetical protein